MEDLTKQSILNNEQINYFDLWELDDDYVYGEETPNILFFSQCDSEMNTSIAEIINCLKINVISIRGDEAYIHWGDRVKLLNHFMYSYIIDHKNSPPRDFDFQVYLDTYQV